MTSGLTGLQLEAMRSLALERIAATRGAAQTADCFAGMVLSLIAEVKRLQAEAAR